MSRLNSQSPRKSARDARHAREARVKFWRVSIVSAFFAVVLGANLFVGVVMMVKAFRKEAATTAVPIARVTYPMLDGVFCRHVLFDNTTVQTKEDKVSRCDDRRDQARRGGTTFNWGGH